MRDYIPDSWLDDPYQRDMDARAEAVDGDDDEDDFDDETMCGVLVDGPEDGPCGKPITRIVEEPWTPGRFTVRCCDDCAQGFIDDGYYDRGTVDHG